MSLSRSLLKIDKLALPDHCYLDENDECYYFGEYTTGRGYKHSPTNQLIMNLKKPMDRQGMRDWRYKGEAINQVAEMMREAIVERIATFVPIPPSKAKSDSMYDDRISQVLNTAFSHEERYDVRELVMQVSSRQPFHNMQSRQNPEEKARNYKINEVVANPSPSLIAVVDDVLTTGCHFKAIKIILSRRFPGVKIIGLFIARRVPDSVSPSNFDII